MHFGIQCLDGNWIGLLNLTHYVALQKHFGLSYAQRYTLWLSTLAGSTLFHYDGTLLYTIRRSMLSRFVRSFGEGLTSVELTEYLAY